MFFQEATPDTSGYMIAGYATAFIILAVYVASLYLRNRNLNQDMETIAEMQKPAAAEAPPKKKNNKPVTKKGKAK